MATWYGHNYIGHNYISHDCIGHDCISHNYMLATAPMLRSVSAGGTVIGENTLGCNGHQPRGRPGPEIPHPTGWPQHD